MYSVSVVLCFAFCFYLAPDVSGHWHRFLVFWLLNYFWSEVQGQSIKCTAQEKSSAEINSNITLHFHSSVRDNTTISVQRNYIRNHVHLCSSTYGAQFVCVSFLDKSVS